MRPKAILALCIGAACVCSWYVRAQASNDPQFQDYLRRGIASGKAGDIDNAISFLNRARQIDPNDPDLNFYLGAAYAQKGDNEQGISFYTRAIMLIPSYAEAYCYRGFAYFQQENSAAALSDFEKAVSLVPNHAPAYYGMASLHLRQKSLDPAIRNFNKALESHTSFFANSVKSRNFTKQIYPLLAKAYFQKKDYTNAWRAIDSAKSVEAAVDEAFLQELKTASGRTE